MRLFDFCSFVFFGSFRRKKIRSFLNKDTLVLSIFSSAVSAYPKFIFVLAKMKTNTTNAE